MESIPGMFATWGQAGCALGVTVAIAVVVVVVAYLLFRWLT